MSNVDNTVDSSAEAQDASADRLVVYRIVKKEAVEELLKEGIKVKNNKMEAVSAEMEEIFKTKALEAGIDIDRTKCIYAFPDDPRKEGHAWLGVDEDEAVIEIEMDLNSKAIVCDGEYYTESSVALRRGDREQANSWAQTYWENAVPLKSYLENQRDADSNYFSMPEILIPQDIPSQKIRLLA